MTNNYDKLNNLVKQIAYELYGKEDWDAVEKEAENHVIPLEYNSRLEEVYATAFERYPEVFDGAQWINSEEGFPVWVREGVEWVPDHELDEEEED